MAKCKFSYFRFRTKFLATLLLLLSTMAEGLRLTPDVAMSLSRPGSSTGYKDRRLTSKDALKDVDLLTQSYGTGSSLPDCSHACGPCTPCRRVLVSFKCSLAESCPMIYKCMCKGRYYHVPSY